MPELHIDDIAAMQDVDPGWMKPQEDGGRTGPRQKKRSQGRKPNAAVICLARRRCVVIYSMLRHGTFYEEKLVQTVRGIQHRDNVHVCPDLKPDQSSPSGGDVAKVPGDGFRSRRQYFRAARKEFPGFPGPGALPRYPAAAHAEEKTACNPRLARLCNTLEHIPALFEK
jgi:hypothetical protein